MEGGSKETRFEKSLLFPVKFDPVILFLQVYDVLFLVLFLASALHSSDKRSPQFDTASLQKPDFFNSTFSSSWILFYKLNLVMLSFQHIFKKKELRKR